MPDIKKVFTPKAPTPGGHYSQAVVHNGLVYVAGQLPIDPGRPGEKIGSIEIQAERALKNLEEILRASGSSLSHILKITVYISDIRHWEAFDNVYARILGDHRPARTVVPVKELHFGYQVEIDAIAALDD